MSISIKSIGGSLNNPPKISDLKVTSFEQDTIDIEYKVEDVELTICRHYLLLNEERVEITKEVGYESSTNIFKYQISGLKLNTPYTIQIAATDGHDEGLSKAIQQTTKNLLLFGIRVMENNSNPSSCVTYIEEAAGVTPANSTSLGGWEDKFPFNKIKIVGFKNGQVVKEIKKEDKTKYIDGTTVPSDVDVMIQIPKVYWKFNNIPNGYELRISNVKIEGSDCYAHKVGEVEKDYIYVGAYLGYNQSGKLRSISGVSPTTNITLANFRQYAQANGNGYQQFNWFTLLLLQNLYLIAYKNLNSQIALGYGYTNGNNSKINTGGTNTKGFIYGENSGKQQMCFLGIEDFYGNVYQWVDGMKLDSSYNIMITPDNKNFNDNGSGFKNLGKSVNNDTNGHISKVVHTNEGGFFPKEFSGSNSTYYSDYGYAYSNHFARFGGDWAFGFDAGAFRLNVNSSISYSHSALSSRLCYLG